MISVWVLVIVTSVRAGSVVSFQEFDSKKTCENAKVSVVKLIGYSDTKAICLFKGNK